MNTNILLTGGRAPVTLELARLLSSAGHHIFVAESLEHHLCRYSSSVLKNFRVPPPRQDPDGYILALLDIIQQEQINLLIPTCEEIFYIARSLHQLKEFCDVFAEPLDKLNNLHNKWKFIQRVQELNLPVPQTWLLSSQDDLRNHLCTQVSAQVILKPVYSRFGSQVIIISTPIKDIPQLEINESNPWIAQEFIIGKQYCTYSIAHEGQLKAHAVYPTSFTAGIGSSIYFESVEHLPIFNWIQNFIHNEQFTGQIAFDFIETSTGTLYPLECNPRATSGIHLFQESDQLERAFFNLTDKIIQPQKQHKAMVALAMIVYGLDSSAQLDKWFNYFFNAQDVIFRLADPMPFLQQTNILWELWQISQKNNINLTQATTLDIEWNNSLLAKVNPIP